MSELPDGWTVAPLSTLATIVRGVTYSKSEASATGGSDRVALLRATNIGAGLDFNELYYVPRARVSDEQLLRRGDIVVATSSGSSTVVGKSAELRSEWNGTFGAFCSAIRPAHELAEGFVAHFITSPTVRRRWSGLARGSNINNLRLSHLADTEIPVPPVAEQHRIVTAIEEALSKLDAGEAGLRTVSQLLKRMREAVLAAAVTGRLVPQDPADTSATEFLANLGVAPCETGGVPDLPPTWAWGTLGSLADLVGGVTKDAKKQDDPAFVEVPYLRVANVQRGFLDLEQVSTIRVPPAKAAQLALVPGDVLFNEGGDRDKLGRGWIWEGQVPGCIHQNHVFRARLAEGIEPKLVSWWGNTFGKGWFEGHGRQTTNLASLSLTTLKTFPIPIAPPEEQRRIVAEVDRQLSFLVACERSVDAGVARSAGLRRSVLKSAFQGRLVPQDPSDEPASSLLARVGGPASARSRKQ